MTTKQYRVELTGSDQNLLVTLRNTDAALQRNERSYGALAQQMVRTSGVGTAFTQATAAQGRSADALAEHLIQAANASQRFGRDQEAAATASERAAQRQTALAQTLARARGNAGQATELGGFSPEERLAAVTSLHQLSQQKERGNQAALANIREAGFERERNQYRAQRAFLDSLNRTVVADEASRNGKGARAALLELQAAQLGVTDKAAPMIARLAESDRRLQSFSKTGRLTALELQQVGFQLNDLAVQVASGQSPITALIQQGSQLSGTFGGVRPALSAVLSLVTPARVAVAGLAGSVLGLGAAYFAGQRESRVFNDSVVLTGNYAGRSAGDVNAMARSIASISARPIGDVRDALQAVVASGKFGPENVRGITEAVVGLQRFSGQAAEEIVKNLSRIADDPAKAAIELNRQYNFLTPQIYAQVKALQEQGRQTEAVGIVVDALNTKYANQRQNLGLLERAYEGAKRGVSGFWDSLKDIGRDATPEDRIEGLTRRLAELQAGAEGARRAGIRTPRQEATREAVSGELTSLSRRALRASDNAFAEGDRARINQEAISGLEKIESTTRSVEDKQQKLNRALREYRVEVEKVRAGNPNAAQVQPAEVARIEAGIRKQYADKPTRGGNGDSEAAALRRAVLDDQLRDLEDANQRERDDLSAHQALLDAQYRAGEVSLAQSYAQRDALQAQAERRLRERNEAELELLAGFQDDALNAGDARQAAQVDKQITASLGQQARLEEANAQRRRLDGFQYAETLRQQSQALSELDAQVLALTGDERELARVRIAAQVFDARRTQQQAGAVDENQLARYRELLQAQEGLRQVQERAALASARAATAEDLFLLQAESRGATLQEIDEGVFQRRSEALEQLRQLTAQAAEYARISGDPRAAQQAAEMGLAYQRAVREIDPAINRLRTGLQGLADGTGDNIGRTLGQARSAKDALQEIFNSVLEDTKRFLIELTITAPLKQNLRALIEPNLASAASALGVGSSGGAASASSDVASAAANQVAQIVASTAADAAGAAAKTAETAATTSATAAMISVTTAANAAALALSQVATQGGASSGAGLLGSLFGGGSAGAGGVGFGGSDGVGYPFAKGGAFGRNTSAQTHAFAKGGVFTNRVFNRPTPFRFARGGVMAEGVMGEAGEEAVMPLARTSSGRLGVEMVQAPTAGFGGGGGVMQAAAAGAAAGAAGAASTPPEVHINIIGGPADAPKVGSARQRPGGGIEIDVVYGQMRDRMGAEIDNGTGLAKNINGRYGLNSSAGLVV